ncbi:MAG: DUF1598 domain-containing protein [Planctomycetia bacterium]|nr:DUF1598 domain-containing protein [Planctomycetia bacterium]
MFGTGLSARRVRLCGLAAVGFAIVTAFSPAPAGAQVLPSSGFIGRAVGGISIDADGVLANAEQDNLNKLAAVRAKALEQVPGDLLKPNDLRKVSLRGLATAVADCQAHGKPLPDEVKYLAGLQRVRYVFVYPDSSDIVLAGFGEGWKVGPQGTVVGVGTGRPVLLLDDLLVAMRSATAAAQGGITCSIDPTPEGVTRLRQAMKYQTTIGDDPQATIHGIEQQLGPQVISVTGVPETSHFARVMVAADYRMKRLAMAFEPAPVAGLPSFLEMLRPSGRGARNMMPRWWLATNYEPMLTDAGGLAWELRGPAVKAMTEDSFFAANGAREQTGKADPTAQKWAEKMTAKYDELSMHEPIFGELRNCMDLAVITALIVKENLAGKANCDLSAFTNPQGVPVDQFAAPKQVESKASFIKKGDNWIISASGGVQIHSWGVADRKEPSTALAPVRQKAAAAETSGWRWN